MPETRIAYTIDWIEPKAVAKGAARRLPVTVILDVPAGFAVRPATEPAGRGSHGAGPHAGLPRDFALVALRHCKFEDPESIIDLYPADRILDVCYAALHSRTTLKNRTGYIYRALKLGWEVRPRRPQGDQ